MQVSAGFPLRRVAIAAAALLAFVFLSTGAPLQAQESDASDDRSLWQSLYRGLTSAAADSLQDLVDEFRSAGAIGDYDFLIRKRKEGLEVVIEAEILDAERWAKLKGIKPTRGGQSQLDLSGQRRASLGRRGSSAQS